MSDERQHPKSVTNSTDPATTGAGLDIHTVASGMILSGGLHITVAHSIGAQAPEDPDGEPTARTGHVHRVYTTGPDGVGFVEPFPGHETGTRPYADLDEDLHDGLHDGFDEDDEAWAPIGPEETEEDHEELVARVIRDGEALRRELGLPGFAGTPADPRPTPGTSTETKTGTRTDDEPAQAPRGRRQPRRPGGRRALRRVRRALDYSAAVSRTTNRLRMLGAVLQLTLMTLGIVALCLAVFRGTTPDIVRAIGACACVVALLGRRALRRAVVRARHTLARGMQMYLGEQLDDHRHAGDRKEV
ncbi:hypothetical protein ACWGJT_32700 [Streptomyces xantholiticus]